MFSLSYQPESGDQTTYFVVDQSKKRIKLKKATGDNSQYVLFEKNEEDVLLRLPPSTSEDRQPPPNTSEDSCCKCM